MLWGNNRDGGSDFGNFDPNDRNEIIEKTKEALEEGMTWIGKIGQEWQGDTPNDELARGLVASGTMQLDTLHEAVNKASENPKDINPLLLMIAIQAFETHMRMLAMLNSLSDLRT